LGLCDSCISRMAFCSAFWRSQQSPFCLFRGHPPQSPRQIPSIHAVDPGSGDGHRLPGR
jgi:hypothetical protein